MKNEKVKSEGFEISIKEGTMSGYIRRDTMNKVLFTNITNCTVGMVNSAEHALRTVAAEKYPKCEVTNCRIYCGFGIVYLGLEIQEVLCSECRHGSCKDEGVCIGFSRK